MALLVAAIPMAGYGWLYKPDADKPSSLLSPFHFVIAIGTALLFFVITDPWYRSCGWPAAVSGLVLLLSLSRREVPVVGGLMISGGITWVLLYILLENPTYIPAKLFQTVISTAYSPSVLFLEESNIQLPAAIEIPPFKFPPLLFYMAHTITLALLNGWAFSSHGKRFKGLQWVPLFAWLMLIYPLVGQAVFLMELIYLFLFCLFMDRSILFCKSTGIGAALLCMICLLGYAGIFEATALSMDPFHVLGFLETRFSQGHFIHIPSSLSLGFLKNMTGQHGVIPLVIACGLLFLIAENGFYRQRTDLRYPMGISLLMITGLTTHPSMDSWLVHPLTWLSIACIQNAHRKEFGETTKQSLPFTSSVGWALTGLATLLILVSAWNLLPNWRSDRAMIRFASTESRDQRIEMVKKAFLRTPYRPDIASLYATDTIVELFNQAASLSSPEREKMESILAIAQRHRYIPILAYSRLSTLLFLSEPEQSIRILEKASSLSPRSFYVHEILADKLDTVARREKAVYHYHQCINLDPFNLRVRKKLIATLEQMGRQESAEIEKKNLNTLNPFFTK